jgi:hypothetical protein
VGYSGHHVHFRNNHPRSHGQQAQLFDFAESDTQTQCNRFLQPVNEISSKEFASADSPQSWIHLHCNIAATATCLSLVYFAMHVRDSTMSYEHIHSYNVGCITRERRLYFQTAMIWGIGTMGIHEHNGSTPPVACEPQNKEGSSTASTYMARLLSPPNDSQAPMSRFVTG